EIELPAAPPGQRGVEIAHAIIHLRSRRQPAEEEIAIGDARRAHFPVDRAGSLAEKAVGVDCRLADRQLRLAAEFGIARIDIDGETLPTRVRRESDRSINAPARQREIAGYAALAQR